MTADGHKRTSTGAKILDGNALAASLREDFKARAQQLTAQGVKPCLAVILVGDSAASAVYVRNKVAACEKAGIESRRFDFDSQAQPAEVFAKLAELNADPCVHGILVQLPLPPQFDAEQVLEAVAPGKDVDGFHAENFGLLLQGRKSFYPCTPWGVMQMLDAEKVQIKGAEAVVIGRSNIVGKPMAVMLLSRGATVTVCHSQTRDLAFHTRRADIVVAAVGKARFLTGDMLKAGATVIDVGINRLPDGKLCGDVDFDSAKQVAGLISPVPGGVGPMTITMLLGNTLESAERVAAAQNR